jgi:cell wall-associated NlpC family hydrolase
MSFNSYYGGELAELGRAVTSRIISWFFKGILFGLAAIFAASIVIMVVAMNVFGVARNPLQNRAPGAVAGLPPGGSFLDEIPADQLSLIKSTSRAENLPWEITAAIIRVESGFGKAGQNYAGLSEAQWQQFAPDALADFSDLNVDFKDSTKSIKILVMVLADKGIRTGVGPAIESGVRAYRPGRGETYFYKVLQVAGRYGFVLPGSFEEKLINLAMAQEGKPYIWAATGPEAFDCSGLTLYVHAQLGVKLPRNSEAQYFAAEPVANDQLMPGDMFFLENTYSDPSIRITHVGIYKGGGIVIHAPQEGETVREERIDNSFFQQHWFGFARAKRSGMIPPTSGANIGEESGAEPVTGDWRSFDVTRGEPKPEAIDRWLSACGGQGVRSPQLDEAPPGETIGQVYLRMGRKYGINPAYAAAFFTKESSCGTAGNNLASHNFGNRRAVSDCATIDGTWCAYPTWTDGMEDWFRMIKLYYVNRGLLTIDQIVRVYAPSFENDTRQYIDQVKQRVTSIMSF